MSDADEIERIIDTLNTGGLIDREDVAVYFGHLTARIAELEKALKPFAHVRYFKGERHEVRGIHER